MACTFCKGLREVWVPCKNCEERGFFTDVVSTPSEPWWDEQIEQWITPDPTMRSVKKTCSECGGKGKKLAWCPECKGKG